MRVIGVNELLERTGNKVIELGPFNMNDECFGWYKIRVIRITDVRFRLNEFLEIHAERC